MRTRNLSVVSCGEYGTEPWCSSKGEELFYQLRVCKFLRSLCSMYLVFVKLRRVRKLKDLAELSRVHRRLPCDILVTFLSLQRLVVEK
jgi:hypothetical protein